MKNMTEIRELLSDQMDSLRKQETTPGSVNAVCNATGKFLSTIKLEMEFARMTSRTPEGAFWTGTKALPTPTTKKGKKE
jgi:hypothetical protein